MRLLCKREQAAKGLCTIRSDQTGRHCAAALEALHENILIYNLLNWHWRRQERPQQHEYKYNVFLYYDDGDSVNVVVFLY